MQNAVSGLVQAIPAILAGFKGKDTKKLRQTSGQMEQLADAQYNMDNPLFQRIYGQEQGAGQQDLASTISELSRQNRKLVTMGRTPLLDQERGGESIFRQLMMGQQDVGNRARQNTFSQLGRGQQAQAGVYDAQNDLVNTDWENELRKVGGYYSLGDALKGMFNL
jgi:hypothetical protein